MKGKISTKAIVITILTVVLLAVATTGTVLFLKDNGEAAAATGESNNNTEATLPVTGDQTENQSTEANENGQEQATTPDVNSNGLETVTNPEQETVEETITTGTTNSGIATTGTTPAQTTRTLTEEPETSTVERERVTSQTKTLGWNSVSRDFEGKEIDFEGKKINYSDRTVTAKVNGEGGTVEPETQSVIYGEDAQTIVITPAEEQTIKEVKVNGVVLSKTERDALKADDTENNKVGKYTFTEVKEDKTLEVTFGDDKNNNGIPDDEEYRTITYTDGVEGEEVFADQVYDKALDGLETPAYVGSLEKVRTDYVFVGWNPEVATTVNGDATYTATWKDDKNNNGIPDDEEFYTVKFVNDNGDVLQSETLVYGTMPEYKGTTPTKVADVQYTYTFLGWTPEVVEVTEDATYTATYNGTLNNYTVTWLDYDGKQIEKETYPYGETVVIPTEPTRTGYNFAGWTPDVQTTVTENATYTAQYEICNFDYVIEYYYDGIKDENKTVLGTATYGTTVSTYPDKNITGYKLENEVEPITIATTNNVMKVYYIKDSFTYTIEYYKDTLDSEKIATKGGTDSYKKLYKTELTEAIVTSDAGQNWINENRPNGYKEGTVTYTTIEANNNVVKVLYTPRTDLSYTVKYFYNGVEDTDLEEIVENQTYGTIIENVTDKTSEHDGGWELLKTEGLPLTVGIGEIVKVFYTKSDISVEKIATPQGTVEYGDTITYTIKATNNGGEGKVVIADTAPEGTEYVGELTATGYNSSELNEEKLANGIELTVPANGTAQISFKVKVIANVNTEINNAPIVNGVEETEKTVTNKIEKTVPTTANTETIKGTNIILVIDTSGSMDDKTSDNNDGWLIHRCEDPNCTKTHRTRYALLDIFHAFPYNVHTRMTTAIDAACRFIDQVYPNSSTNNGTTISVIEFNDEASAVGIMANSYSSAQSLKTQIRELDSDGGTEMGTALDAANTALTNLPSQYKDNNNVVIFLSDGEPTDGNAYQAAANSLKNGSNKADIYTIGFEVDGSAANVLKNIASNGQYYGADMNGLFNTFDVISSNIKTSEQEIKSENGLVELNDVYADSSHPITIKVNGTAINSITSLPTDKTGKIILDNGKYYLDLNKFNASDKVEIEYFSK